MENKLSGGEDVSPAKAVLLGALAPGVNGATWNTLKLALLLLGLCLAAMLGLAFSSSDSGLIVHVTLLVLITGTLFILLSRKLVVVCGAILMMHLVSRLYYNFDNQRNYRFHLAALMVSTIFGFLAETGLVSVEHQMQEMGLAPKDCAVIDKKSS